MKEDKHKKTERTRLTAIAIISILVIITGALFSFNSIRNGNFLGGLTGGLIAVIILIFAVYVYRRGNRDLKKGYPLRDERSNKVLERASSRAFYISLYLLLAVGFLSDSIIKFRDVSQATSISVGLMAILWAGLWLYYNKKEL